MTGSNSSKTALTPAPDVNSDFLKFWIGQTISALGSSITFLALPLLIFKLTGSALNLGIATASLFLVSVSTLALVRRRFNDGESVPHTSLRADVVEGLRYVLGHPVLRSISLMMLLANFVFAPFNAQLVLFAHERLGAGESRVGWLY